MPVRVSSLDRSNAAWRSNAVAGAGTPAGNAMCAAFVAVPKSPRWSLFERSVLSRLIQQMFPTDDFSVLGVLHH
jgi:hypothetical protein